MTLERAALGLSVALSMGLGLYCLQLRGEVQRLDAERARAVASLEAPPRPDATAAAPPRASRLDTPRDRQQRRPAAAEAPEAHDPSPPERRGGPPDLRDRPEADWQALRAEMEARTVEVVDAYGAQQGWEPDTTEEVLAILLETADEIGAVWAAVRTGENTHYQARKQMHAIRETSGQDLEALIGADAHEALDEHLFEARRDMWSR